MPLSNLVVCQMLCIYFNYSMKVLRYIYFQKNLETLVPISLFFIVAFIKSMAGFLKKNIAGEVQKQILNKLLSSCWRPIKFEEI